MDIVDVKQKFICALLGNTAAGIEPAVHIHRVQRVGTLVGMLVVAFVVASEASEAFGASSVVAVDKALPFACPWRGSSSLGDKKERTIESMVKHSWTTGYCLVSLGREEGPENLVHSSLVEPAEGTVAVHCSSFVGRR